MSKRFSFELTIPFAPQGEPLFPNRIAELVESLEKETSALAIPRRFLTPNPPSR